jgi:putative membrane protein
MLFRWLLASFHLLAFGLGLGAIWVRGSALRGVPDPTCLHRALRADNVWGIAALLWLGTGLPRLLLGTEKPTSYYLTNHLFWLKLALFGLVFLLEIVPMVGLIRWRIALARGKTPEPAGAARWSVISRVQAGILLLILFAATGVARGAGS